MREREPQIDRPNENNCNFGLFTSTLPFNWKVLTIVRNSISFVFSSLHTHELFFVLLLVFPLFSVHKYMQHCNRWQSQNVKMLFPKNIKWHVFVCKFHLLFLIRIIAHRFRLSEWRPAKRQWQWDNNKQCVNFLRFGMFLSCFQVHHCSVSSFTSTKRFLSNSRVVIVQSVKTMLWLILLLSLLLLFITMVKWQEHDGKMVFAIQQQQKPKKKKEITTNFVSFSHINCVLL